MVWVNVGKSDHDKFQCGYSRVNLYFHLDQFICGMSLTSYMAINPKYYLIIYIIIMHDWLAVAFFGLEKAQSFKTQLFIDIMLLSCVSISTCDFLFLL